MRSALMQKLLRDGKTPLEVRRQIKQFDQQNADRSQKTNLKNRP
jgi:hypothetical protein